MNDAHLKIEILGDVNKFIKMNPSTREVTSPIYFSKSGVRNPEGLLSDEIFGLTKETRASIFGYIDLAENFIHPLIYKKWSRMDGKIREIVHGTRRFILGQDGTLIPDENGETGLTFLKLNIDKIKIKESESLKVSENRRFIEMNRKTMWLDKWLVCPAYYRDVNTEKGGKIGVGEINQLYASLLISARAIKETQDYGLDMSDSVRGRIQETLLAIYDWFSGNTNDALEGSSGLSKKLGIIRRAGQSKTTDYGSRLILSAPELKVEYLDDIMVDIKHCAVPLASLCANFFPYMLFNIRRYFENEFGPGSVWDIVRKDGTVEKHKVKDPFIQFSDERIKDELQRFILGYSNRFDPIMVEVEGFDKPVSMRFKGYYSNMEQKPTDYVPGRSELINRRMTWCDLFFIAANDVVKDKAVLVTRYPIDSSYNQFPSRVVVSSTKETEPIFYNNKFYKYYPIIREEDIGSNTSNKFVDTMRISNLLLKKICGDYDGDTISVKSVFTKEANEELLRFIDSKANYIGANGQSINLPANEAVQSIYNMTRVLKGTILDDVIF